MRRPSPSIMIQMLAPGALLGSATVCVRVLTQSAPSQQWYPERPPAPQRIHPRKHPPLPIQAPRTRAYRASPVLGPLLPRAPPRLRPQKRRIRHRLHSPALTQPHSRRRGSDLRLPRERKRSHLQEECLRRPIEHHSRQGSGLSQQGVRQYPQRRGASAAGRARVHPEGFSPEPSEQGLPATFHHDETDGRETPVG